MADIKLQKVLQQLKDHESRIRELERSNVSSAPFKKDSLETRVITSEKVSFDMSERAFVKKYRKEMSGPKKFVLLLSYLVKGKIGKEISVDEVEKHWNKLKSVLKAQKKEKMEFNSYYANAAKNNNWVDSKKFGFYFSC